MICKKSAIGTGNDPILKEKKKTIKNYFDYVNDYVANILLNIELRIKNEIDKLMNYVDLTIDMN